MLRVNIFTWNDEIKKGSQLLRFCATGTLKYLDSLIFWTISCDVEGFIDVLAVSSEYDIYSKPITNYGMRRLFGEWIHNDLYDNNKDIIATWSLNVLTISAGFDQWRLVLNYEQFALWLVSSLGFAHDTGTTLQESNLIYRSDLYKIHDFKLNTINLC